MVSYQIKTFFHGFHGQLWPYSFTVLHEQWKNSRMDPSPGPPKSRIENNKPVVKTVYSIYVLGYTITVRGIYQMWE